MIINIVNLEKYLAIAGMPGIHKLVANRPNGLVVEDRHEGRTRFVPLRQQQVTPLGTIAVYVDAEPDTIPLGDVFQKMMDAYETTPPVPQSASSTEFRAYFSTVLPEHDHDRVHINDIKKCLKWFTFMHDKGIFAEIKKADEAEKTASEAAEKTSEAAPENVQA